MEKDCKMKLNINLRTRLQDRELLKCRMASISEVEYFIYKDCGICHSLLNYAKANDLFYVLIDEDYHILGLVPYDVFKDERKKIEEEKK